MLLQDRLKRHVVAAAAERPGGFEAPISQADVKENIRTMQELLGHKDVKTTMIYIHVMNQPGLAVCSDCQAGE